MPNGSKKFTRTLNDFRAVFALTLLRLEERLSAARLHSRHGLNGILAHQSPVQLPRDRAPVQTAYRERTLRGRAAPAATMPVGSDGHRHHVCQVPT